MIKEKKKKEDSHLKSSHNFPGLIQHVIDTTGLIYHLAALGN